MKLFVKYLILISKLHELKTGKNSDVSFIAAIKSDQLKAPLKKATSPISTVLLLFL
jgi:hypothetical protein